jgi:hypothetical protein
MDYNLTSVIANRAIASISDGDFSLLIGLRKLHLTVMISLWHHMFLVRSISLRYPNWSPSREIDYAAL